MMSAREPLEWYFKLLDQSVGLSFKGEARGLVLFLMSLEEPQEMQLFRC